MEKSGGKGGQAERELKKKRIVMKRARHDASKNERDHVRRRRQRRAHTLTLLSYVGVPPRTGSRTRGRSGVRKWKQGAARMRRVVARVGNRSDRGWVEMSILGWRACVLSRGSVRVTGNGSGLVRVDGGSVGKQGGGGRLIAVSGVK